jgi:hypothetical protein
MISVDGHKLEPHRVDLSQVSDSILTEILSSISRCRLFLADISTVGLIADHPVRNANVMYEVGLAHAVRQPEEVVLVRSDDDQLSFDVSNVRVHRYDPDGDSLGARRMLRSVMTSSLDEVDNRKGLAVRSVADSLDGLAWLTLLNARGGDPLPEWDGNRQQYTVTAVRYSYAVNRLLEVGALRAEMIAHSSEARSKGIKYHELVQYRITPFGEALARYGLESLSVVPGSIRSAASRCCPGSTCEYTRSVIAGSACPSASATAFTDTPFRSAIVA